MTTPRRPALKRGDAYTVTVMGGADHWFEVATSARTRDEAERKAVAAADRSWPGRTWAVAETYKGWK